MKDRIIEFVIFTVIIVSSVVYHNHYRAPKNLIEKEKELNKAQETIKQKDNELRNCILDGEEQGKLLENLKKMEQEFNEAQEIIKQKESELKSCILERETTNVEYQTVKTDYEQTNKNLQECLKDSGLRGKEIEENTSRLAELEKINKEREALAQENQQLKDQLNGFISSVPVSEVKKDLDCDGDFNNEAKQEKFDSKYTRKRVDFTAKVHSWDSKRLEVDLSETIFSGNPQVILRSKHELDTLEKEAKYSFNCRIDSFCKDGTIRDGELRFGDCTIK